MNATLRVKCLFMRRSTVRFSRFYCDKPDSSGSKLIRPLTGIRKYLFDKCFRLIKGYENILETKFPRAFRIYQVFAIGTRDLYTDIKEYARISSSLRNGKSVQDLQREELERYFKVPKDLMKVGPVLLIAALPFANYVILPVIYLFPRQFLTSQFWSLQQKVEFAVQLQRKKLYNYRPVFRHLQAKVNIITDALSRKACIDIFAKIGSGTHPSVQDILEVKDFFIDRPYGMNYLSSKHLRSLCRIHGLSALPGKRSRLGNHGGFVREIDLAILREGLPSLSQEELRFACFLRGLNPMGLSKEDIIDYLTKWLEVAKETDAESISLLLHCPIFLAYNNTSNWVLIH